MRQLVNARASHLRTAARQRGFTLIELSVALLIIATLSLFTVKKIVTDADDASANAIGTYVRVATAGLERYVINNFTALTTGTSITGVATTTKPTMAELKTLGRLSNTFPVYSPNQQQLRFDIARSNCPGAGCTLTATACLTGPLTVRGIYREDLVTTAMMAMGGTGGRSHIGAGAIVRGASFQVANPVGNIEGILCGSNVVDPALYDQFVKMYDTRDPGLQGNLSVAGGLKVGSATSGGASCALAEILTSGQIISRAASCVSRAWMDGTNGQIGAADVSGTTRVLLDGTSGSISSADATGAVRAGVRYNGTQSEAFADSLANSAGTAGVKSDGTVYAKSAVMGAATLAATATINTACTTEGAMSFAITGTSPLLMRCTSGIWKAAGGLSTSAAGAACTPNGSLANDANGVIMICSGGKYISMVDRMGYTIFYASYNVTDGGVVPKPACQSGTVGSRIYLYQGNQIENVQSVNRYITDNGTTWTVFLRNEKDMQIQGDIIAVTYCLY